MFNPSSSGLSDRKNLDPTQALFPLHNWDVSYFVSELPQFSVPFASLAPASNFSLIKELNMWRFLSFLDGLSRCGIDGTSQFAG